MPLKNRKKLRKILAVLDPSEKGVLATEQLKEDTDSNLKIIIQNFDNKIKSLKNELLRELDNYFKSLPDFSDDIISIKKDFVKKIDNIEKKIKEYTNNIETEDKSKDLDKLKIELEKKINNLNKDFINRLSNLGGGNMNRNILVDDVAILNRYTDLNIITGSNMSLSYDNNDVLKTTDLTIDNILSLGTSGQIPYMNAGGTDFLYSAGLTFDGNTLLVKTATATGQALQLQTTDDNATNNLLEIQNSSGTPLTYIEPDGEIVIDQDSKGIKFGADQDITLWSTGAGDLTITPLADTDITLNFTGTTNSGVLKWMEDEDYFQFMDNVIFPVYERHVQIDAQASGTPANQPTAITVGTAVGYQFSSAADKYLGCQWEIPDDWDGTDAYIEIDWFPDSGAISGTDAIRWVVEYRSIAEGETITNGTLVTVDNGAGGDTADYAQYETKHTRFTLDFDHGDQPMTKQDHMYFLIHRDTGVTNDFAGTVVVTAFEIIYNSIKLPTSN